MSLNFDKIFTSDACQCKAHVPVLISVSRFSKIMTKNIAVAHFHKSFRTHPLCPSIYIPEFLCQMEGLIKLHNQGKFH